jgi:hypothetical protein
MVPSKYTGYPMLAPFDGNASEERELLRRKIHRNARRCRYRGIGCRLAFDYGGLALRTILLLEFGEQPQLSRTLSLFNEKAIPTD